MGDETLQVIIKATDQASAALKSVAGSVEKLATANQKANPLTKLFGGSLGGVAKSAIGTIAPMAGVAAAVGMATSLVKNSISDWVDYNQEIRKLSIATGAAPEDLSRMMQAADDLGVSMDSLQTAFRLAAKNGIQPTIGNIANLSNKLIAIKDPTERAKEASKLFGRQWAEIAPFILAGGDAIRAGTEAIADNLVVTEDSIATTEEYRIMMDDLSDTFTGIKNDIAMAVIPAINDLGKAINGATDLQALWNEAIMLGAMTSAEANDEFVKVTFTNYDMADAVEFATKRINEQRRLFPEAADEGARFGDALKTEVAPALEEVAQETQTANDLMRRYSDTLLYNIASANLDADAQVELARKMGLIDPATEEAYRAIENLNMIYDINRDGAIDAGEATHGYMMSVLGLKRAIEGLKDKRVTVYYDLVVRGTEPGKGRQHGGPVLAGQSYLVGERGPEMFVPEQSGMILPNRETRQITNNWSLTINEAGQRGNVRADFALLRALAGG
jgi:hypothetical protein